MYIHAGATLTIALNYSSSLWFPQEIGVVMLLTLFLQSLCRRRKQVRPSHPGRTQQINVTAPSVNGRFFTKVWSKMVGGQSPA